MPLSALEIIATIFIVIALIKILVIIFLSAANKFSFINFAV